jgi:hypothetical protein
LAPGTARISRGGSACRGNPRRHLTGAGDWRENCDQTASRLSTKGVGAPVTNSARPSMSIAKDPAANRPPELHSVRTAMGPPVTPRTMVAHAGIRFAASQSSLVASRIGIARSVVLAICVGIELRAVARVGDDPLRPRWRCKSGKRHDSRTYQCKLHKALLYLMIGKDEGAHYVPPIIKS